MSYDATHELHDLDFSIFPEDIMSSFDIQRICNNDPSLVDCSFFYSYMSTSSHRLEHQDQKRLRENMFLKKQE